MKVALLCIIGAFLCHAQDPIWDITGGPVGVGNCYDIVTEQMTFPAFSWSYNEGNTVRVRGTNYLLPDQVYGYASPEFKNDTRIFILNTFQAYFSQYLSTWGVTAGLKIDGIGLDLGFSHTKGQINQMLNNSANYFSQNTMTWVEFVLQVWPGESKLHPHFLAEVNKLPTQYDYDAYLSFIRNFGTHVIKKASYGAAVNFTSVFHSNILNKQSIEWVQNQVKLSLGWQMINVGFNWNSASNKTAIDNTFLENSQNVTTVQGGEPDVLASDGYKAWWQTVLQEYAVVFAKSTVVPIFDVIPNKTIAQNLKTATITYGGGKPSKPIVVN